MGSTNELNCEKQNRQECKIKQTNEQARAVFPTFFFAIILWKSKLLFFLAGVKCVSSLWRHRFCSVSSSTCRLLEKSEKKVRVSMFGRPFSFGLKCFECRRQMFCLAFHFLSRGTCGGRRKDLGGIKVEVKIWQFCSVRWFEEQKMIRFCQICAYLR